MKAKSMRSYLRLSDLRHPARKAPDKLMNVRIPVHVSDGIARVARELGVSKTEAVIALFNEGLDIATERLRGWEAKRPELPPPKRVCSVRGCNRAHVARGYCVNHYQAMRRGGTPAGTRAKKRRAKSK